MKADRSTATDDFVAVAEALADQIWTHRVHAQDGSVTWLRPGSETSGEPILPMRRLDPFLYDGTAGIALYFAALARVTGNADHGTWSLQALAPVRRKMSELTADPDRAAGLRRLAIGGFIGLGSLIYGFSQVGALLGDPELQREALGLVSLLTGDRIASDASCDVLYGGAGAILSLLALHDAGEPAAGDHGRLLQLAHACGSHLLDRQITATETRGAWQTLEGRDPVCGFSHGASGICYALCRLLTATGEGRFLATVRAGLGFERQLFFSTTRRPGNSKAGDGHFLPTAWCTGSAGIALSRLGILIADDDAATRDDARAALESTRSAPLGLLDHLCCGNFGRIDALLQASLMLEDEGLRSAAEGMARESLKRARRSGSLVWRRDKTAGLFDPTFFTGAAGAGYALLRIAFPSILPCALLLEPAAAKLAPRHQ